MAKRLLTDAELAQELSVATCTVRKWARRGIIPVIRPTSQLVRFDLEDVVKALKERGQKKPLTPCGAGD
jgi:excisionase family DNA binding protein